MGGFTPRKERRRCDEAGCQEKPAGEASREGPERKQRISADDQCVAAGAFSEWRVRHR